MTRDPSHPHLRLGLDFGGVIVRAGRISTGVGDDTIFDGAADPLDQAREGALETVAELVAATGGQVWIVSKARPVMQERSRRWLEEVRFFERTGFDPGHLHFCLEREGKAPICRELGLTHFVDDRVHLMQILDGFVDHRILFVGEEELVVPPRVGAVRSWGELRDLLLGVGEG